MSDPLTYESVMSLVRRLSTDERAVEIYRRETLAAWTRAARNAARWLDANRYLLDRRRYNRARRNAVRAVLEGLSPTARGPSRRARGQ